MRFELNHGTTVSIAGLAYFANPTHQKDFPDNSLR